jgi:beta-glucosidase
MRAVRVLGAGLSILLAASLLAQAGAVGAVDSNADSSPVYLDRTYSFDERAADLVSRMTLTEKAYQLATTNAPAIPRLGVQEYAYWGEAAHGVAVLAGDYYNPTTPGGLITNAVSLPATSYPTALSAAATWNPALIRNEGVQVSDEARGFVDPALFGTGDNNLGPTRGAYGSLFFWSPTVNMLRDPRWGRGDDNYGEDPFLQGAIAGAYVEGIQGIDAAGNQQGPYLKAAATAKHFALNNVEGSRFTDSSNTDEATIRDYYTPQFRRLVERSKVAGLMTSYNAINEVPAVANNLTLNVLARRTWGFDGYVTSDCGGVGTAYRNEVGANTNTGHDWAAPGWSTNHAGIAALWTNDDTGATISGAAGGQSYALRAGNDLNCFGSTGQPANPPIMLALNLGLIQAIENDPVFMQEAIAAGVLSEAVIDRALVRAFTVRMQTGEFDPKEAQPYTRITKDVIQSEAHKKMAEVVAGEALVLLQNNAPSLGAAPLLPADPTSVDEIVILGDLADKAYLGGYSGNPVEQISVREGLTDAIKAANPDAKVTYDSCGTSTRTAVALCSPLTDIAIRTADLVVVMVGTDSSNGEGSDRADLALAGSYTSLIDHVALQGNRRVVLLDQSSGPVELEGSKSKVSSILYSAANGQRQGRAAANVIFGKVNPSARLPFTWYKDDSQLPDFKNYNLKPSQTGGLGRTYQYFTGTPSYPFGHGLSYTKFGFSNTSVDRKSVMADGQVRLTATVTNTGSRPGATVVQSYAEPPNARAQELPYRLAGFAKTRVLAPQESQTVSITIPVAESLRLWDASQNRMAVPNGLWTFSLATAARRDIATFTVDVKGAISTKVKYVHVQPEQVILTAGDTVELMGKNSMLQGLAPTDLHYDGSDIVSAVRQDDSFVDLSNARVTFASNRPEVASIDARGTVTAVGPGTVTISVTVGGVSGSSVFVVGRPSGS